MQSQVKRCEKYEKTKPISMFVFVNITFLVLGIPFLCERRGARI